MIALWGVLLLLVSVPLAASFGDVQCGYPVEQFAITEFTCIGETSNSDVEADGEQENQQQQLQQATSDHQACGFGDTMYLQGTVQIQAVTQTYKVKLQICFKRANRQWYSPTWWFSSQTCLNEPSNFDLGSFIGYEGNNNEADEEDGLQAGNYYWSVEFEIPKESFTFRSGSIVEAYATYTPEYPDELDETVCYASLDAVPNRASYMAVGLTVVALGLASFFAVRKNRRLLCRCDGVDHLIEDNNENCYKQHQEYDD